MCPAGRRAVPGRGLEARDGEALAGPGLVLNDLDATAARAAELADPGARPRCGRERAGIAALPPAAAHGLAAVPAKIGRRICTRVSYGMR